MSKSNTLRDLAKNFLDIHKKCLQLNTEGEGEHTYPALGAAYL